MDRHEFVIARPQAVAIHDQVLAPQRSARNRGHAWSRAGESGWVTPRMSPVTGYARHFLLDFAASPTRTRRQAAALVRPLQTANAGVFRCGAQCSEIKEEPKAGDIRGTEYHAGVLRVCATVVIATELNLGAQRA